MSDKSFVTIEQHVCPVCGKVFESGALLLDRRMQDRFERTTVTQYNPCTECQEHIDRGFIALVECDPTKSNIVRDKVPTIGDAYRTGKVAWLRKSVTKDVFNIDVEKHPMLFVEPGVIDKIVGKVQA